MSKKDADAQTVLAVESIGFGYGPEPIVSDVSFTVRKGETFAIAAAAGSGITTLLKLCAGLLEPQTGRVDLFAQGGNRDRAVIGFVFQRWGLLSNLSAFENVALPLLYHGPLSGRDMMQRVHEGLAAVDVVDLSMCRPGEMSPSMVKRVQLARALVTEPEVLFLDTLDDGLDEPSIRRLRQLVDEARQRTGMTVIEGVHTVGHAGASPERVAVLSRGKIVACGAPDELRRSSTPEVSGVLGPRQVGRGCKVPGDMSGGV